ncbi:hypothetical protein PUMCH_003990 [Australozyma saopauloensis]|uniref:Uncharacterized protein n=1 Tax=Australozyma saopauloensis TaxID=291208 RepID=A0AAX4HEB3_9ASCO|nr:hypothetical protein PUMCH_003990 [[Candida] saopauloensis]
MNPFVFFAGWLPIIDMIMSFMALIPGLLTRQSNPKMGTKPVTLKNHRNKKYMHWEKEILKNARDTKRSIRERQCYSETDRRTMIEVIDKGRDKLLGKILEHAKIEDDNLDMLGKMRNSVRGATVPEPKFWREGLIDLQNDIKEICFLPSNRQQDQLPYGAKQELNVFFEKLLSSANGRLDALLKLYEDNYQGAWVTFYIRFRFGFSKLRAWGKLIVSSGTLVYLTTVGLEYILSISENYPRLAERIKFYVALALLLFTVLAYSTGLTWYFVSCLLSGTSGLKEFFMNKKSSDKTKKSWLSDIYGKSFTWCFWWHGKLEDPSLQANVYNETACELWEEIPLKDQSSINPADDERGLRTGSNNLSASVYWTPLEDMNPASAMRVARIY